MLYHPFNPYSCSIYQETIEIFVNEDVHKLKSAHTGESWLEIHCAIVEKGKKSVASRIQSEMKINIHIHF